jgi:hypothetical protein
VDHAWVAGGDVGGLGGFYSAGCVDNINGSNSVVAIPMLGKLFTGPAYYRDQPLSELAQIRQWWESRRWYFNKVVGCVGIFTCILMISCGVISESLVGVPIGIPDPPLLGPLAIVVYGIGANLCFTGGRIVECLLRSKRSVETNAFAVRAFRAGMKFSVILTLIPAVLSWVAFGFAVASGDHANLP